MNATSPQLDTTFVSANESALIKCQTALELKELGDCKAALNAMRPFWPGLFDEPNVSELHPSVAAEVRLCSGILACWTGSQEQITQATVFAAQLINQSIEYFKSAADVKRAAAARIELALCRLSQGNLDEARDLITTALPKLSAGGTTWAKAIISLTMVESAQGRLQEAVTILADNATFFSRVVSHTYKGSYRLRFGSLLEMVADIEKRNEYLDLAREHYEEADYQFKLANDNRSRVDAKIGLGNVFLRTSKIEEAHQCLDEARRLALLDRNRVKLAQVDEARARVLVAEARLGEAEPIIQSAISVLEKNGQRSLLADALVTHGVIAARLKQTDHAQCIFQRAIELAHQTGAQRRAAIAALTLIEELDGAPLDTLCAAFDQANQWLSTSQNQHDLIRGNKAAEKLVSAFRNGQASDCPPSAFEAKLDQNLNLHGAVLKFEQGLVRQALVRANGSVTRAAPLLGLTYQGLAYVIESRHRELLKERTPIRRRPRKQQLACKKPA